MSFISNEKITINGWQFNKRKSRKTGKRLTSFEAHYKDHTLQPGEVFSEKDPMFSDWYDTFKWWRDIPRFLEMKLVFILKKTSSKGDEYDVILIGKTAKQFIIQHINEIAESVDND